MKNNNKGFTMVELIVSVALLAVILVPISGFFMNSFKIQGKTSRKTAITRAGQYIIENFKNKNYDVFDDIDLVEYVANTGIDNLVDEKITKENGHQLELAYQGVNYKVDMEVKRTTSFDNSSLAIPKPDNCYDIVEIASDGNLSSDKSKVRLVNKGAQVIDPPFGSQYTADYPTIILEIDRPSDPTNLWIRNNGYGYVDEFGELIKEQSVRVIKNFKEELHIYVEGMELGIEEGPKGGLALAKEFYLIKSTPAPDSEGKSNVGEVVLDVEMVISDVNDENIRDVFEFSFPVDYDFSNI